MRVFALLLLISAHAAGSSMETIRRGLSADSRGVRESAESAARRLARSDPAGVAALWDTLDARGRRLLIRALASAGTRHAALVALKRANDPSPELFRGLLSGLVAGGERALFAELPPGLATERRRAVEALRLRWKVEKELVRLKSPAGSTGHYTGQFSGFKPLGRGVIAVFFDIVRDRAIPLQGEASSGLFTSIHPHMVRYDRRELRELVAHGFGEITDRRDTETIARLKRLHATYWSLDPDEFDFEHNSLAPSLAYSLHDIGERDAAREYIAKLEDKARLVSYEGEVRLVSYDEIRARSYDEIRTVWSLGYANIRIGNYRDGQKCYDWILDLRGAAISRHVAAYNLACNYSMRARQEPKLRKQFVNLSLGFLERAVYSLNWWDWGWMEEDGDLDFIRKEPRYQQLLAYLKKKWPSRRRGKQSKDPRDFLGGK